MTTPPSSCYISFSTTRPRNGSGRRVSGSRPRPNSPSSSAKGSSDSDEISLTHRIPDSPRTFALELAMRLLFALGLLQRGQLAFGQHQAFLGGLGFERLEPLLHRLQIMALPDPRAPRPAKSNARACALH